MARGKKKESALTPEEKLAQALVPDWEQPYKVPENWCWTTLSCLVETSKEKTEDFSDLNVKYVGLEHIEKDSGVVGHASAEGVKSLKNVFHPGQILYGKLRPYLNKHDVVDFDGVCSTDILVFNVRNTAVPQYVNYFLNQRSFIEYAVSNSKGINLPRVSETVVLEAVCPLPPLTEQQRIVDRIEYLFAKLDEAKEKAQSVLESFETRKAAILHKAFTGELTAKWRAEHGVGMDTWKYCAFRELCEDIVRGGSPRPAGSPEFYDGPIPFMKVADITRNNSPYVSSAEYSIKEAGLKKTRMVSANTLLLTNSGATLGVPAICTFETTFNDGIAAFLGLPEDTLLFYYYFWTSKTSDLRAINKGAAQPNLNTSIIGDVEIDVPSDPEKYEIVRILESLLTKEEQAKETAEAVLEKIDLLKKSILARAFRGELGTNDPTEQSAIELLKEVLQENKTPVPRKRAKSMPKDLQAQLTTALERKIIKMYFQQDTDSLPVEELLSIETKKFEIMEALRNLEQSGIIKKLPNGNYRLLW